jgi:predicted nucleic acid-binding protein
MSAPRLGGQPVPRSRTAAGVLLDTGVLIALHLRNDPRHTAVTRWMTVCSHELHTTESVLTEAAYFMPARSRHLLADLAASGAFVIHTPGAAGYARVSALLRKYADVDPDWADIELIWLAETTGITRIATLDVADFSVYRIHGRKRFELELLR